MLSSVVARGPAASSTDVVHRRGSSLGAGERPAEPGELAGDRDRNDRAALGTLAVRAPPDVVQALLGLPGDRQDAGGLMGYLGLVPSENASGATRRQGAITKTGSRHARRLLVEDAWHYRK